MNASWRGCGMPAKWPGWDKAGRKTRMFVHAWVVLLSILLLPHSSSTAALSRACVVATDPFVWPWVRIFWWGARWWLAVFSADHGPTLLPAQTAVSSRSRTHLYPKFCRSYSRSPDALHYTQSWSLTARKRGRRLHQLYLQLGLLYT